MMRSMLAIGISGRQVSYPNQARLGFRRDGPSRTYPARDFDLSVVDANEGAGAFPSAV